MLTARERERAVTFAARGVLAQVLSMGSNPCGRGAHGTPLELARGGGHHRIAQMIEAAIKNNGQIDHMIEEAVSENKSTLATELAHAKKAEKRQDAAAQAGAASAGVPPPPCRRENHPRARRCAALALLATATCRQA